MVAFKYFQVNISRDVFIQKDLEVFYSWGPRFYLQASFRIRFLSSEVHHFGCRSSDAKCG